MSNLTKVRATHITFASMAGYTTHVEGDREEVVSGITTGLWNNSGVWLPTLQLIVPHEKGKDRVYRRDRVWFGRDLFLSAVITDTHDVMVTDEKFPEMDINEQTPGQEPKPSVVDRPTLQVVL